MKMGRNYFYIRHIPAIILALLSAAAIIIYPTEFATGAKNGLALLGESVIPALFPFMVLSTYLADNPATQGIFNLLHKFSRKVFNVSGVSLIAPTTGMLGGYPIGAQAVARLFEGNLISQDEAHRLLCWSINPSPTFAITFLGKFLMGNTACGTIMYASNILASLTIGVFLRFLGNNKEDVVFQKHYVDKKNIFVNSVATSCKAMLSICGWVLLFSAFSNGINSLIKNEAVNIFLNTVSEVSVGCNIAVQEGLSLPIICAIIGFGGFAVIFQIAPYLEKCNFKLKYFICWRLIIAALSAFYCTKLIALFPNATTTFENLSHGYSLTVSHTPLTSIILIFTCILLVFEVDNKRKIC